MRLDSGTPTSNRNQVVSGLRDGFGYATHLIICRVVVDGVCWQAMTPHHSINRSISKHMCLLDQPAFLPLQILWLSRTRPPPPKDSSRILLFLGGQTLLKRWWAVCGPTHATISAPEYSCVSHHWAECEDGSEPVAAHGADGVLRSARGSGDRDLPRRLLQRRPSPPPHPLP